MFSNTVRCIYGAYIQKPSATPIPIPALTVTTDPPAKIVMPTEYETAIPKGTPTATAGEGTVSQDAG